MGKRVLVVDGCVDYGRDQGGRGGGSEEGVLQGITPPKEGHVIKLYCGCYKQKATESMCRRQIRSVGALGCKFNCKATKKRKRNEKMLQ